MIVIRIDERRCFFQANFLGKPLSPPETPVLMEHYTDAADHHQNMVQAWFAGVHSDVGGSYTQSQSAPAMDAFKWILTEANADGLQINKDKRDAILGDGSPKYPALTQMNHPAKELNLLHSSLTWKWAPLEAFPHKYFDETGTKRWRLSPLPHSREIPDGSLIHPSLRNRLAKDEAYKPKNLDRAKVEKFTAKDFADSQMLLHQKVILQLEKEDFAVYRPNPSAPKPASSLP
jgi:Uncharacterized alpha/beta hydrolase domain (DUF2235)